MNVRKVWLLVAFVALVISVVAWTGCGGNVGINSGGGGAVNCGGCGAGGSGGATGGAGSTSTGAVAVTLVDPPTCMTPRANYSHLYVTVNGVQVSPTAGANAATTDWVDVIPNMASNPKQIDLFGAGLSIGNLSNSTTVKVDSGTYRTIRLFLANTTAGITSNQCGASANCTQFGSSTIPIDVTDESTNGIIIGGNSIKDSQVVVASNGTVNLNLEFDSCASLLPITSSTIRFIPKIRAWTGTLHSVQVAVSDATSGSRIASGDAIVTAQQPDSIGVDRVVAEAAADATGVATLYLPDGTFDMVADATISSGSIIYSPLAVTGFDTTANGSTSLTMALTSGGPVAPGSISGVINATTSGIGPDVRLGVLQSGTFTGVASKTFTIPLLHALSATTNGFTQSFGCTTTGVACTNYSLTVPGQPLYLQTWGSATSTASSSAIDYTVDVSAFKEAGSGTRTCTNSTMTSAAGTVTSGVVATAPTIDFTGCN